VRHNELLSLSLEGTQLPWSNSSRGEGRGEGRRRAAQCLFGVTLVLIAFFFGIPLLAQPPLRRHDDRPAIDLQKAQAAGISRYASKRLILLTDIESDKARQLVTLVDQVYPTWEQQLGPVPPARDKSDFQITGFLMRDEAKFERAGLVRKNLKIVHGQHSGYEFWMKDADYDYYREHLLLHEASHCVMQSLDDGLKPIWYLEGMAEFFGSHGQTPNGLRFGIVPASRQVSPGFGRIEMIRTECAEGRALGAADVVKLGSEEFSASRSTPYAWSWAFCTFLSRHPRFAADFQQVCQVWETERFPPAFDAFWKRQEQAISAEWEIFRDSLCYGWDIERGASVIDAPPQGPLDSGQMHSFSVQADRGWQNTGLKVIAGQTLEMTATGRVVLAKTTRPWESEAQGISIRYSEGRPIGRLQGAILRDEPLSDGVVRHWEFIDLGPTATVQPKSAGQLYLRVNDRWNELGDNSGHYEVRISAK
jgi:hypothetical protein